MISLKRRKKLHEKKLHEKIYTNFVRDNSDFWSSFYLLGISIMLLLLPASAVNQESSGQPCFTAGLISPTDCSP